MNRKEKSICWAWLKNKCRHRQCKFSHDPNDNIDCRYWLRGGCKNKWCKFRHLPTKNSAKNFSALSDIRVPNESIDKIGVVILKYYLDAFLHIIGGKLNKDLINLIGEYCTDRHFTTASRLDPTLQCTLCLGWKKGCFKCVGCDRDEIHSKLYLVYLDNEPDPIVVCRKDYYECLHRLGLTLNRIVPTYISKDDRIQSLTEDLTITPCALVTPKDQHTLTASFFGFKPFTGIFLGLYSWDIPTCRCNDPKPCNTGPHPYYPTYDDDHEVFLDEYNYDSDGSYHSGYGANY